MPDRGVQEPALCLTLYGKYGKIKYAYTREKGSLENEF